MDSKTREAYDATRNFANKAFRSACYAPFTSLYFLPSGDALACCKSGTFPLGNMVKDSLDEVWNGRRMQAVRTALKQYRFPKGCEFCEWQVEGGNYTLAHTAVFEKLPVPDEACQWPVQMEFALSNLCNYECIMCSGFLSSRIRANREGLPPLPDAYPEQFFLDLRKYLPHLRIARWFGGEPFLAPQNYRIWDMMIEDRMHPDLAIEVTTNASTYNEKVERVIDHLPFSFAISIDGITKETLEAVRIGSDQKRVLENVQRFHSYTKQRGTQMAFAFCLMRQNWHEFAEFLCYAENLGCPVWLNTVVDPDHCSLYTLPATELAEIAAKLERQSDSVLPKLKINRHVWVESVADLKRNADEWHARAVRRLKERWTSSERTDHISAGWKLVGEGKFAAALAEARQVEPTDPGYYFSLQLAAHALRRMRDFVGSEQVIDQAIEFGKRTPEAYVERAWLRHDQGRLDDGIKDAEFALTLKTPRDESRAAIYDALGFLWRKHGQIDKAIAAFDNLVSLQPHSAKAYVHRGNTHAMGGDRQRAAADAKAALAIDATDAEAKQLLQALGV